MLRRAALEALARAAGAPAAASFSSAPRAAAAAAADAALRRFAADAAQRPADAPAEASADAEEGLRLTPAAAARLAELAAAAGGARLALRLAVDGGGCSGFQYAFSLDDGPPAPGDVEFTAVEASSGADEASSSFAAAAADSPAAAAPPPPLVTDAVSLSFLKGAVVDYESDLMRAGFVVRANPNAEAACGCGSSFAAK
jgi:Fe-S cluster assembly iron-binding protein IscA